MEMARAVVMELATKARRVKAGTCTTFAARAGTCMRDAAATNVFGGTYEVMLRTSASSAASTGLVDVENSMKATTVLCVRKKGEVVIMADGQMTLGSEVVKNNVKKVRRIGEDVIGGFAGATTDAFTLFERLEQRLEEHPGQLTRAAVELAKAWRTDRYLRRLNVSPSFLRATM